MIPMRQQILGGRCTGRGREAMNVCGRRAQSAQMMVVMVVVVVSRGDAQGSNCPFSRPGRREDTQREEAHVAIARKLTGRKGEVEGRREQTFETCDAAEVAIRPLSAHGPDPPNRFDGHTA
jgi:hypothetical protein